MAIGSLAVRNIKMMCGLGSLDEDERRDKILSFKFLSTHLDSDQSAQQYCKASDCKVCNTINLVFGIVHLASWLCFHQLQTVQIICQIST